MRREPSANRGAQLLRDRLDADKPADVARSLGVSRQCLEMLCGRRRNLPSLKLALAMQKKLAIPPGSWIEPPEEVATMVAASGGMLREDRDDDAAE